MARAVLITGARAAAALDIAREFAAAGWHVHLADSVPVRMARWSSLAARHHRYPPPRQQGQAFRAAIARLVADHAIALVVPSCEEVFHLAAPSLHRRLGSALFAPGLATLRALHDKLAFARNCARWDLPAPESHALDSAADLERFAATSAAWVFKPRYSRFGDAALVSPTPAQLAKIAPAASSPWLAQRRILGEEACFHAAAHEGKLVAFAAYGSDWRLGGGARYAFETLDGLRAENLRQIAARLAQRAAIHGQFACDVMFDAAGKPWLIECNPRATSGVHLLAGRGDLARALADGVPMPQPDRRGAFLGPAMVLFGLPRAIRTGNMQNWRQTWADGRDAITGRNDLAPMAGALVDAARFALAGLRHGISTNAATTRDIEWNGEELD